MPALRDPMSLRMDKVVGGFQRTAVALLGEGSDLIFEPLGRHRKIRDDLLEHRVAGVLRGKQTLDILHHENGGLVHLDDSQVLPVEEVLFILVKVLVVGASGAPRQRIRPAGRAADQYPGFLPFSAARISLSIPASSDLPSSGTSPRWLHAQRRWPRQGSCGKQPHRSRPYVAVVVLDVLGATQTPEHCPERQRAMCDSILFNGKGDLEEWLPLVALQDANPSPSPPGPAKDQLWELARQQSSP